MRCRACATENRPDAAFCLACGAKLALACPSCGRDVPTAARFCDGCGARVADAPSAAPGDGPVTIMPSASTPTPATAPMPTLRDRPYVEGERRTVTVLFIDAVASVAAGARTDAEQLARVVQDSTAIMIEAVRAFEGTVTQFRGDGIMAIFGAPVAHEDSARRAVAAALQMRARLIAYREAAAVRGERGFRYRIGINTGPVIVGTIGKDLAMDYSAVGDTVNLAARMEQWAAPDAIYITAATKRLVEDCAELRDLGLLEVKGRSEGVRAYEVVRELPARTRIEASAARGLTPYIGREVELRALQQAFEQAARGRGQVVFIAGEAGLGKSRLLFEFRRWLGERARWAEGRCVAYGATMPYQPIVEIVRACLAPDGARDPAAETPAALAKRWGADGERAAPHLARLLRAADDEGGSGDVNERRAGILDALRALLMFESSRTPLVAIVEDVHWLDEGSEVALCAMVDAVASMPVLMLLTHRPGWQYPGGDRTFFNRLNLHSLSDDLAARMLTQLLPDGEITQQVRELVMARAEGNPFFLEEVTRALLESGAVRLHEGAYVIGRSDGMRLPDTVHEVILSRLDRLDRAVKEVVQRAAIIGREFDQPLLAAMTPESIDLERALLELRELELIYEVAYFPARRYMFKHALTHDVALSTLLGERKRRLHREAAAAIEALHGEHGAGEHSEELARHYYEGEDWPKAYEYARRSAQRAQQLFAARATIEHATRALESAGRAGLQADPDVYRVRGHAHEAMGDFDAAREDYERALSLASSQANFRGQWDAEADLGMLWAGRDYSRTGQHFERAHELAQLIGDPALIARSLNRLGNWHVNMGRPGLGIDRHDEALRIFRELGDRRGIAETLDFNSMAAALASDTIRGWRHAQEAAALYRELGDRRALANLLSTLPAICYSSEVWTVVEPDVSHEELDAVAHESLAISRAIGWPSGEAFALMAYAAMLCASGRYGDALSLAREALALAQRIDHRQWETASRWALASCLYDVWAIDEALAQLRIAADNAIAMGSAHWCGVTHGLLALTEVERGDLAAAAQVIRNAAPGGLRFESLGDRAVAYAAAATTIAQGTPDAALRIIDDLYATTPNLGGDRSRLPVVESLRAEALLRAGRAEEAEAAARSAAERARARSIPPIAWRALARLADALVAQGKHAEARQAASAALAAVDDLADGIGDPRLAGTLRASPRVMRLREVAPATSR
jgi:class 3 adenylate cyclase